MKTAVLCALLCVNWCCATSGAEVQRVASLKQQCVAQRRTEEDALQALGKSSGALHEQCARWAWRQVR